MAKADKATKTEAKAEKPEAKKSRKATGPEITGLNKFNPCRQYAASRAGGSRPSERLFLVDEMLKAKDTNLKEIQTKAAERWASACKAAGDKRDTETLVTLYRKQIPVNTSTVNYIVDTMDLAAVVNKKFGVKPTFKYDDEKSTFSTTFKQA